MYAEFFVSPIFVCGFFAIVIIILALRCAYYLKAQKFRREFLRRNLQMRHQVFNEMIVQQEIIHQQQQQLVFEMEDLPPPYFKLYPKY